MSFLGLVELNQAGNLQMSNLLTVIAGGLTHALKYIKGEMQKAKNIGRLFLGLSALSFFGAISFAFNNYIKKLQAAQLKESFEKSQNEKYKMPDQIASLMDLECRICMNDPCNIVLVPCNHLCMCVKCFKEMEKKRIEDKKQKDNCPMCK